MTEKKKLYLQFCINYEMNLFVYVSFPNLFVALLERLYKNFSLTFISLEHLLTLH